MLVPNKLFTLDESTLYKSAILLSSFEGQIKIIDLYNNKRKEIESISDFIDCLSLLYVIGKINYIKDKGVITHA